MTKTKGSTDKKSFILYVDFGTQLSKLTDEAAGKLIKSVYEYQATGTYSTDDPVVDFAMSGLINQFERDAEKWEVIRDKRVKAGKASASKRKHMSTHVKSVEHNSTNPTVTVNDTVSVTGTVIEKNSGVVDLAKQENKATATSSIAERDAEFLALFNSKLSKKFRVMPTKASHQLTARLKDGYTVAEILSAAKACSLTEYHRKNKQHLTPEFITRGDKLQMYADMEDTTDKWVQDRVNGRGVENMRGQAVNADGKTNQQWKEEQHVSTK